MAKTQSFKFEIEKFNGSNNFELWKVKMRDMLVQQGVAKALVGKTKKPYDMSNEDQNEIDEKALNVIRLCLVDDVLFNIVSETTTTGLSTKLEILYMNKYLTNKIHGGFNFLPISYHISSYCGFLNYQKLNQYIAGIRGMRGLRWGWVGWFIRIEV